MNSTDTLIKPPTKQHQPSHFGDYIVREKIGEGAMGSVYKAYDPAIDRIVAIKTVSQSILLQDETGEFKERFLREIRAVGKINHPNVISILHSGKLNGSPFFVMEYVEGRELKQLLRENPVLSIHDSQKIFSQILDAIAYSHDCGVIHRDIKPSNIFIDTEGKVKVADFGIAKHNNSEFTQYGSIMGTPSYMSPEQCQGKDVDHRSDIFSSAVVFYEMLTGKKCFSGSSGHAITHKTITSMPEKPSKLNPKIPKALDRIILKALSKKPSSRYQTAIEFKEDINEALNPKKNTKQNFYFIKYTLIISVVLLGIFFIVNTQNIIWKDMMLFNTSTPSNNVEQVITHNNLSRKNKVLRLLKVANAHNLVGRYVAPQGSNAYSTYKLILSLDPNNAEAKQGLKQVNALLLEQIKLWASQGKNTYAISEIKIALNLFPNDSQYLSLLKSLTERP